MPYNAMIRDEQTGEALLVWAVTSESPRFVNDVTGEPIDTKKTGGILDSNVLGDHIHHKPLEFTIMADLVGGPGGIEGSVGGPGYDVEQYNKLVAFSNRDTTFSYTSYTLIGGSPRGESAQPGLTFPFLAMTEFYPVKSAGGKGENIIAATIKFQSVVITYGRDVIYDPDVAYGRGERDLRREFVEDATIYTAAATAGLYAGLEVGALAIGALTIPGWIVGLLLGAAAGTFIGSLDIQTGSVPRQQFTTEIDGVPFDFELRSNPEHDIVTFSMSYEGTDLVREQRVIYGVNLLAGVTHRIVHGLHIIPLDPSGSTDEVTCSNLGRAVQLMVLQQAS